MAFNPGLLMHARELMNRFREQHPKVEPFMREAESRITEGSVVEMKVTTPDGREICSNIRITADDMEMIREVREAIHK